MRDKCAPKILMCFIYMYIFLPRQAMGFGGLWALLPKCLAVYESATVRRKGFLASVMTYLYSILVTNLYSKY